MIYDHWFLSAPKKCPLSISLIHFARILNRKARLCQEIAHRVFTRMSTDNKRYSKASLATLQHHRHQYYHHQQNQIIIFAKKTDFLPDGVQTTEATVEVAV